MNQPRARFLAAAAFCLATSFAGSAEAYTWMINHGYTGCVPCHADPSGGSLLTTYGRAQGEILLRTRYGSSQALSEQEAGSAGGFLFGLFDLKDTFLLGGDLRGLYLSVAPEGAPRMTKLIFMQSDLQAQLTFDRVRGFASVGYAHTGGRPAAITHSDQHNVVSRVHWLGVDLGKRRTMLLRAGRMNLPFGVRVVEHTLWIRRATGTDIDTGQQHGVSFAFTGAEFRGELMAILGNFQMSPAELRKRGYSAFFEHTPLPNVAVGLTTMATNADIDLRLQMPATRHAHGLTLRTAPSKRLVVLTELDVLAVSQPASAFIVGYGGFLQVDYQVVQGIHLIGTGEMINENKDEMSAWWGGWLSLAWFFAPHADLRADALIQSETAGPMRRSSTSLLLQLHVFL